MDTMLLYLAIVVGIFLFGDLIGSVTKARLSTVFVALLTFLILFLAGVLPADIIEQAGLTKAASWALPVLVFHLGTMINVRQFLNEWRTVVTSWLGMAAVIVGVLCMIPLIGKTAALVAIPVVNGALPATTLMSNAAMERGLPAMAALASVVFAVQKFVGTPFVSRAGVREAKRLLEIYRKDKAEGKLPGVKTETRTDADSLAIPSFCERYKRFYTANGCFFICALGGYVSVVLSNALKAATGIDLNYCIIGLILSTILASAGLIPKNVLDQGKASGFITMVVFAAIIPALAKISIADIANMVFYVIVIFAAAVLSVFLFLCVLPGWKIIGSRSMAFGVGLTQMLGFPSTYLVSNEAVNAVAETDDEREYLQSQITPRFVVGGLAAMVSVIIAGVMISFL